MGKNRARILLHTLQKIPLFGGLSPTQMQQFLAACQPRRLEAGTTLCARGTPPDEMYLLLSGSLGVVTEDGAVVATLSPVTTIGELGIFTRHERCATVETLATCNVLVVRRAAFEAVLAADLAAAARVYRNVVEILTDKIVQDNVRMRDYLLEKVRQEERIRELRRRAEIALDVAASEGGLDPGSVASMIDDRMEDQPRLRILIVDDEAEVRIMLSDALADYDTVEARDGEEALAEVGDEPPDLVVTDIRMPGMDGYALVQALKARAPQIPVLAISGYVSVDDINDYAFDGFLEKPMNLKKFRELVDHSLAAG